MIFQHPPVKEKVKKIEVNRMRNEYTVDVLTFVGFREIVKIGGRLIEIYEGVIYRKNFEKTPFRKTIGKLFALKHKNKDDGNYLVQGLVKNNHEQPV